MQSILLAVFLAAQPGVATVYVDGLLAAEEAYRKGGSEESLAPVRAAIARHEHRYEAGAGGQHRGGTDEGALNGARRVEGRAVLGDDLRVGSELLLIQIVG